MDTQAGFFVWTTVDLSALTPLWLGGLMLFPSVAVRVGGGCGGFLVAALWLAFRSSIIHSRVGW